MPAAAACCGDAPREGGVAAMPQQQWRQVDPMLSPLLTRRLPPPPRHNPTHLASPFLPSFLQSHKALRESQPAVCARICMPCLPLSAVYCPMSVLEPACPRCSALSKAAGASACARQALELCLAVPRVSACRTCYQSSSSEHTQASPCLVYASCASPPACKANAPPRS